MDIYYLILVVPTLLLSLIAQFMVKSTFSKYSKVHCSKGVTGTAAASLLLKSNNINDVQIEPVAGSLTDHYSPSDKKLRLSEPVYGASTLSAVGVAAHETGHAIQHARKWGPLVLRSTLVPVANIGSQFGPILAIAGLGFTAGDSLSFLSSFLFNLGIILFSGAVLFYVITLPVEFNASNRAIAILRSNNVLSNEELKGVRKVLNAAALTYVASALTAIASLLRLILLSRSRR
ncbi:MAG: zinc metallopeptidase [Treponema sp.]|jgi:Zn-dependent membrane protease YugP|nr:zinc metallopeptidase [Treponema sp.]